MTQDEISKWKSEVYGIIRILPPLKERIPAFKRPIKMTFEESYSWLINDWMPKQKDFDILVRLTCLLNFHMELLVAALIGEAKFDEILSKFGGQKSCMKYRKRPVIVDAVQWFKDGDHPRVQGFTDSSDGWMEGKHGPRMVFPGDYIVTEGENVYPVRPDVFLREFEEVK